MASVLDLIRDGKKDEVWKQYCGFFDLSLNEYMALQRRLLEEQIARYSSCPLGRSIMKGRSPRTVEEFRETVPFTTYKDYAPFLLPKDESSLPVKPHTWSHTSGRSGEYDFKWVPFTRRMYELAGEFSLTIFILSAAKKKGDIVFREGMKIPYTIAPPPYITGLGVEWMLQLMPFTVLPTLRDALGMDFQQRIQVAFSEALNEGMDFFFGITSIMLKISERFSQLGRDGISGPEQRLKAKAAFRIALALLKARLRGRLLLPRDIWNVKGVMCGGMDTSIFRDKVTESWGIEPLEAYVATEFGGIAIQAWNHAGLTFYPYGNFWEFISEADYRRLLVDPTYQPRSYLMDEVSKDTEYVLVGTNFHGGPLCRFILGDLVKFVSLEDEEAGIRLPQMTFVSRIDGLIDVGGFTRLTEKTIWQAIENSGVSYEEWTIRKEQSEREPILHLYIEQKKDPLAADAIAERVHEALKALNGPYRDLEEITGLKPLKITLLSTGTFRRYYEERQAAGADLAHLKPPHVNASDGMIENLLRMSVWRI
ncbi:MAG TPA: GH3 auxin-responsive promoter family protein [Spirochaetia bacterium]|nr:GH3 auxin-responsive promoter family protein [Spirochaetia bacterium]